MCVRFDFGERPFASVSVLGCVRLRPFQILGGEIRNCRQQRVSWAGMIPPPMVERIIGNVSTKVVTKLVQPQHAAAPVFWSCTWGFCSMPQRAKIFTWRTFFFIPSRNSEPFVAQVSQNWMVAQWYITGFQLAGSWVPFPVRVLCCLSVPLYSDLRFFGVVLTCQVLKDTQNTKASQVRVCSGPLGKVLGTTSACLPCLSAPTVFARETFCLPHVSPVCLYLCCHESVICTNSMPKKTIFLC